MVNAFLNLVSVGRKRTCLKAHDRNHFDDAKESRNQ